MRSKGTCAAVRSEPSTPHRTGHSHLYGVEASHVHLEQSVLPVVTRDTRVVDAPGDVLKRLAIFQEAVVLVVN